MATPATRTPVRIARGSYSNLNSSLSDLQDGEITYAEDQNKLYIKEGSALVVLTFPAANPVFTGNATFDTNTLYVDGTNNRVGIGIVSPTRHLVLYENSSNQTQLQFQNSTTGAAAGDGFGIGLDGDEKGFLWNYEGNDIYIGGSGGTSITIKNDKKIGIGITSPETQLEVLGSVWTKRITADQWGEQFRGRKDRAGSIVQDNDDILTILGQGYDGSTYRDVAKIEIEIDGTPGSSDMPGRLVFATTSDGANSSTERMRIDRSGNVGIGDVNPDGNRLLVRAGSTIGTIKGHIMLAGDSATNGEGPQIVFSESGSTSANAGAYIGHTRSGSNSIGNLVFATRATAGDANTVPTVALTINDKQNATFASAIYGPVKAVSALDLDLSTGNYFTKTINGNSTFTFSNPAASGTVTAFTLELTHTSGNVVWPNSVKWNADTEPTLASGRTHLFMFVTDDGGTRYRGSALVDYVN